MAGQAKTKEAWPKTIHLPPIKGLGLVGHQSRGAANHTPLTKRNKKKGGVTNRERAASLIVVYLIRVRKVLCSMEQGRGGQTK